MLVAVWFLVGVQFGGPREAEGVYRGLYGRLAKINTLQFKQTLKRDGKVIETDVYKFMRPNLESIVSYFPADKGSLTWVGDGKFNWMIGLHGRYRKRAAAAARFAKASEGFEQFASPDKFWFSFESVAKVNFQGQAATRIDVRWPGGDGNIESIYISGKSGLPVGYSLKDLHVVATNSDLVVNRPIAGSEFVMHLPAGSKPFPVTGKPTVTESAIDFLRKWWFSDSD